jgi:hypothetical protein
LEPRAAPLPEEAGEALDVFLDLTHGVFAAPDAASLWREHYLAALRLDLRQLGREKIDAARERWRTAAATEPKLLYSRLGPQLRCEVAGRTVSLVGLGTDAPLSMDVNTAEEGIIRLVPGISDAEVSSWPRPGAVPSQGGGFKTGRGSPRAPWQSV